MRVRRILGRAGKVLLWIVGTLLVTIAVVLGLLHTDWGREKVRDELVARIGERLRGTLTIESLDDSVLSDPTLRGVEIRDQQGDLVARVEKIAIDYSLLSLLGDTIRIDSIELTRPEVELRSDEDGTLRVADLWIAGEGTGPSPALRIGRIEIEDGSLALLPADGAPSTFTEIDGRADDLSQDADDLSLALRDLSGRWVDRDRTFSVAADLDKRGDEIRLADLAARFGASHIEAAEALFVGTDEIAIDANLGVAAADVAALAPELGWRGDLAATLSVQRPAAGEPIAIDLDGKLAGSAVAFEGSVVPEAPSGRGTLRLEPIDLSSVLASAPPGRVGANLELSLTKLDGPRSIGSVRGELRGRYRQWVLDEGKVDLALRDGEATGSIEISSPRGEATVTGTAVVDATPIRVEDAKIVAQVDRIEELAPPSIDVQGAAAIRATVSGPIDDLHVEGSAELDRLRYQGERVRHATLRFDLDGLPENARGKLAVDARGVVHQQQALGDLQATAQVRRGGDDVTLQLEGGEPGKLRVAANARIRRDGGETRVDVNRLDVRTRGLRVSSRQGSITIDERGGLEVEGLRVETGDSDLRIDGSLRRGLTVDARRLDIARLWELAALDGPAPEGTVALHAVLGGRIDRLVGTIELVAEEVVLSEGDPSFDASLVISMRRGELAVDAVARGDDLGQLTAEIDARAPRDLLDTRAWRRAGADALRRLTLTATGVELAGVARLLHQSAPLDGTFDGRIEVGDRAERVVVDASLRNGGLDALFAGALAVRVKLEAGDGELTARADAQVPKLGEAKLEIDGSLRGPLAEPSTWQGLELANLRRARVELVGLHLEKLGEVVPAIGSFEGEVRAVAEIEPATNELRAKLLATDLRSAPGRRAVDLEIGALIGAAKSSATFEASSRDQALVTGRADAPVGFTALLRDGVAPILAAPIEAKVESRDLPLATLAELLAVDRKVGRITGELDAKLAIAGRLDAPAFDFVAELDDARFDDVAFDRFVVEAHADGETARATAQARQHDGGILSLEATTRWDDLRDLDVAMRARLFDLSFLSSLDRSGAGVFAGAAGILDARLTIQGDAAAPRPRGWLRLQKGRVRLRGGLQPLTNIRLTARADDDSLEAELRARSGSGTTHATIEGSLDGAPLQDLRGKIELERFPVAAGTSLVAVSSEVDLEARRRDEVWAVTADIRDAIVYLPKSRDRSLHDVSAPGDIEFVEELSTAAGLGEDGPASLEPIARFQIRAPRTISVRSEEVEATVDAELDVTVTGAGTAITGSVSVVSGRVNLFDRRYEVRTAIVSFGGSIPPNPQLNVQLEHDFGSVSVTIIVTGPLDDPQLVFSSEPSIYDQATLLAIVLGRNPDGPDAGDRGLEEQAVGVAAGFLLGKVRGVVQDLLPVDVLRVDTGVGGGTSRVTVGKWITDDLFVAYRYRDAIDDTENDNEAVIEYELTSQWNLEGTWGDRGAGGLDILWVKRY